MKFNELFPRSRFPLRAKTKVKIPETDLVMRMSVFYQKPLLTFNDLNDPQQTFGMCRVVFQGKKELMAVAVILSNKKGASAFICKRGDWVDITNDDHEMDKALELEKLLCGSHFIGDPFTGLENAEWKSF